ncbi:PREDICTED: mitogen-activated protein kinase-binding protein 1 isoform X2 [Nelumbo nucifera]|uniref:Mitogen-activated protein kinase-binding protein 1 isoform X2 n=1 Tax=Nelumbo nucifera TaxID=4432 RepID=A0A1U7ZR03_NELNU|nr:PREDICTED: mitogen-activated protein kinase-binding protein 1 isoform X2 [Nelumbo nucifera]
MKINRKRKRSDSTTKSGNQPAVVVWEYSSRAFIFELKGHQHGVSCIAFSHDGKHLVSVGSVHDGYLCLWDWRNGRLVTKLKASSSLSSIASIGFSQNANCFVTVGKRHLKLWTIRSSMKSSSNIGKGLLTIGGKPANLGCQKGNSFISVAFTHWAGNSLIDDQSAKFCHIYALTDAGVLCLLHSGFSIRKCIDLKVQKSFALSVSSELIACACSNGIVQLFTVGTLNYAGTLQYSEAKKHHETSKLGCGTKSSEKDSQLPDAIACQFSTSRKLVVVYGDHSLYIWEIDDVNKVSKCDVVVSHSSCIWDIKNLSSESMYSTLAYAGRSCAGGVSFATCSTDGTIRFWDLAFQISSVNNDGKERFAMNQQIGSSSSTTEQVSAIHLASTAVFELDAMEPGIGTQGIRSMAVSSDGKYLAAGDFLGNLHVYNLHTSDYTCFQEAHSAEILSLNFSFPRRHSVNSEQEHHEFYYLLASGGRDQIINLYDVNRGFKVIASLDDHSAAVTSVKLACNGHMILSCSADRSLVFHDVAITDDGCKVSLCHHQIASHGTVYDMAIDPAVEVAVTVGQDKKIKTFNIAAGRLIKMFKHEENFGEPIKVTIDPSSSYMVCSYSNKSICIYDITHGELVAKAVGHGEVITGVIFLPDFKHIISVGGDGCIFIWKLPAPLSSRMLQRMKEHSGSSIDMVQMLPSVECVSHEEVLHPCNINSKEISMLDFSQDDQRMVQEGGLEISPFKFSISRLPKWAQAKMHHYQKAEPESISSSVAGNGGTSTPMCPKVHPPCKNDLGGSDLTPKDSFGIEASSSSSVPQEIPRHLDNRWLTIHTVCLDMLESPEERDFKEVIMPISSQILSRDSAMEGLSNIDSMGATSGDPTIMDHLSVEPYCSGNQVVSDGRGHTSSVQASSSVDTECKNEDQRRLNAKTYYELAPSEVQLKSCAGESMFQTSMSKAEKEENGMCQDDLYSQHYCNLSTAVKDAKDSTGSLVSTNDTSQQSEITNCLTSDNLSNMEGIKGKQKEGVIIERSEIQEKITECKEALLRLDAAADSALQLFDELGIFVSREDASFGCRAYLYDQAVGLLPSIKEKVNALADLMQSAKRNSCLDTRVETSSSTFEPLLGKFAESLSHQVLELVRKNL